MTEGRLEVESKSQECLVIIKREVTSNNLPKRRVLSSTHGVVGGRRLVTASYPIYCFCIGLNVPRESDFYSNDFPTKLPPAKTETGWATSFTWQFRLIVRNQKYICAA